MIESGKKRKRGRPRNDEFASLNEYAVLRLTTLEKHSLMDAAKKEHMTLSGFLRKILIETVVYINEDNGYVSPEEYDALGYLEEEEEEFD